MTLPLTRAQLSARPNTPGTAPDSSRQWCAERLLVLCAGLQSSGSTLVSWCFLQRGDMNGILDGSGDILPDIPRGLPTPYTWCKSTISAFRLAHMVQHYQHDDWQVQPLLVVRDVRAVFNSFITKPYGRNGVTAEEPPLRLRLLRFREDWELFRRHDWPILRYESLIQDPERTLRRVCGRLGLRWDPAMLSWPKPVRDIAVPCNGSKTFLSTRRASFHASVRPELMQLAVGNIPAGDLAWLEREFADFNAALDYPPSVEVADRPGTDMERAIPSYQNTRRYRRLGRKGLLPRLTHWLLHAATK